MRLIIKLIIIIALFFVLYHFYGPQIDSTVLKMKNTIESYFSKTPADSHQDNSGNHEYYPIEKRTQ